MMMSTMSTSTSTNARYSRHTHTIDSCFFLTVFSLDTIAKGDEEETKKTVLRKENARTTKALESPLSLSLSFSLSSFYSFLSSDVVIHVPVVLVSFHVLSIDQTFDSFFQVVIVRRELEFRDDVVDQLRVR